MKIVIDIPEKVVTAIQNGEDYRYDIHTAIAQGRPYNSTGDLISRSELKKALHTFFDGKVIDEPAYILRDVFCHIDNAPTVPMPDFKDGYKQAILDGKTNYSRPQGEWIIVKDEKYGDNVKCPFCGKELAGTDLNFCCKCGAKLVKGGAE